jgi:hypothetical protein
MKSAKKGRRDQVVPLRHSACACADHIYKREQILNRLKVMNSRVDDLAMKVKKVEK